MYSSEVIEEVVSRNDIVDVISNYIKLKKNGSSYVGLCPFHNEKSPSFSVSQSKQLYHCFGCGVGGNVITFVMEYENMTFLEAVKLLGDRAGMTLEETSYSEQEQKNRDIKTKLLEINKIAATYYYHNLKSENGKVGLDYFAGRGLTSNTINRFGLGYAGQTGNELYRYLKSKGYDDELLKETGLFTYERGIHDKFWNRVMFPIMDINNRVIGFGGRVMGEAKPKYLNSPETRLFDKSRNLYGLNIARMSRKSNMIICEGYMDVIALHQAGFNQAVASLGTALTSAQANIMKRYTDNVLITYDSDEAGTKAALRAIPILKEAGLSTRVIDMKPYKDPDEFIKALGAEAFQQRIDKAKNSFMYEISVIEKKYDKTDPEKETAFEREVAEKLVTFSQRLERENYMRAVCKEFSISYEGMRELVASIGSHSGIIKRPEPTKKAQATKRESGIRQAEKILLTWIIDDRNVFEKVRQYITPKDFLDPLLKDVADKLYIQFDNGKVNPATIINTYETEEEHSEVAALFSAELDAGLSQNERQKALNDTVIKVKNNSLEYEMDCATKQGNSKLVQELMMEQIKLKNLNIEL
jgi:DNA primase